MYCNILAFCIQHTHTQYYYIYIYTRVQYVHVFAESIKTAHTN